MTENLEITKNFTVDDIHKVREYNYELTKNMSESERAAYYQNEAADFLGKAGIIPKNMGKSQKTA